MGNKLISVSHWKHCLSHKHNYCQLFSTDEVLRKFVLDYQNNCSSTFPYSEIVGGFYSSTILWRLRTISMGNFYSIQLLNSIFRNSALQTLVASFLLSSYSNHKHLSIRGKHNMVLATEELSVYEKKREKKQRAPRYRQVKLYLRKQNPSPSLS